MDDPLEIDDENDKTGKPRRQRREEATSGEHEVAGEDGSTESQAGSDYQPSDGQDVADAGEEEGGDRRSATTRIAQAALRKRHEAPRFFWFVVAGVVLCFIGVVVVVRMGGRESATVVPREAEVRTNISLQDDLEGELRGLVKQMREDIPEMEERLNSQQGRTEKLEGQVSQLVTASEANRKAAEQTLALIQELRKDLQQVEQRPPAAMAPGVGQQSFSTIVDQLIEQRRSTGLGLDEARLRLSKFLRDEGYTGDELALLRDRALERIGFVFVRAIDDGDFTAELATLDAPVQEAVTKLAAELLSEASLQGRVLYRAEESEKRLRSLLPGEYEIEPAALADAARIARVRMVQPTEEQEALLPELAAVRDRDAINPANVFRLERLVWNQREDLGRLEPGQHLALVRTLSDLAHGGAADQALRQVEASDRKQIMDAMHLAVATAIGMGLSDQAQLLLRGAKAGQAKAADLRVELSNAEIDRMAIGVVADLLRRQGGQADPTGAAAEPTPVARSPEADQPAQPPATLVQGPIELDRIGALRVALLTALQLDAMAVEGAERSQVDRLMLAARLGAADPVVERLWTQYSPTSDLEGFYADLLAELVDVGIGASRMTKDVGQNPLLAVELGAEYGRLSDLEDGALRDAMAARHQEAIQRQPPDQEPAGQSVADLVRAAGGAAVVRSGLRADELIELGAAGQTLIAERRLITSKLETALFSPRDLDDAKAALNEDAPRIVAAAIAQLARSGMPAEVVSRSARGLLHRFTTAVLAERALGLRTMVALGDYLTYVDQDEMVPHIYEAVQAWIPGAVHGLLEETRPAYSEANIVPIAESVVATLATDALRIGLQAIILNNTTHRLGQEAGPLGQADFERASRWAHDHVGETLAEELNVRAFDQEMLAFMDRARQVLQDRSAGRRHGGRGASGRSVTGPQPTIPVLQDRGLPGGALGRRTVTVDGDNVVRLQRGSVMKGYLDLGQVIAINADDGSNLVQVRAVGGWYSPAGKWYPLPPVVLQGTASPNVGGDRIMLELSAMSFELPSGRTIDKEIVGIAADSLDGIAGIIAEYQRNYEKIIPEAAGTSILQGIGAGLAAQNQSVTVTTGSTVTEQDAASQFEQGFGEGVMEGVQILTDYQRQYLDSISPTLEAPNGQPLSVVFFSSVDFSELTDGDWATLAHGMGEYHGF